MLKALKPRFAHSLPSYAHITTSQHKWLLYESVLVLCLNCQVFQVSRLNLLNINNMISVFPRSNDDWNFFFFCFISSSEETETLSFHFKTHSNCKFGDQTQPVDGIWRQFSDVVDKFTHLLLKIFLAFIIFFKNHFRLWLVVSNLRFRDLL